MTMHDIRFRYKNDYILIFTLLCEIFWGAVVALLHLLACCLQTMPHRTVFVVHIGNWKKGTKTQKKTTTNKICTHMLQLAHLCNVIQLTETYFPHFTFILVHIVVLFLFLT